MYKLNLIDKLKTKRTQEKKQNLTNENSGVESTEYEALFESLRTHIDKLSNLQSLLSKHSKNIAEILKKLNSSKTYGLYEESEKCFGVLKEHDVISKQFLSKASLLYKKLFDHENNLIVSNAKKNSYRKT